MQEKIKVITIGDYNISILKNYFKDNENIEFLKLALDESIDNLNTNFSKRDIVFLRTNTENLEKLLEVGKALKEKEIITVTILEEKLAIENKEVLENSIDTIFPVNKKDDIENLFLELIKMIYNIIFERCYINLDVEDVKYMLKDSKKLLIFLDTLEGFVLTEGELITDTLRNESGKTIEDVLFSIRMANRLKNRIECSFIAGVFKER